MIKLTSKQLMVLPNKIQQCWSLPGHFEITENFEIQGSKTIYVYIYTLAFVDARLEFIEEPGHFKRHFNIISSPKYFFCGNVQHIEMGHK